MPQAVILHTIQDAEHCLQHGFHRDAKLFSANVHVAYYLKYHHQLECVDLCSCLKPQEVRQVQAATLEDSSRLLDELDRHLAPELNKLLNLSMRYFTPLYSLTAARQLSLYILLRRCLGEMLASGSFTSVLVYDGLLGPLQSGIEHFLSRLFPRVRFRLIRYRWPQRAGKTTISGLRLGDIPGFLLHAPVGERTFKLKKRGKRPDAAESILVLEPFASMHLLDQGSGKVAIYSFTPWESSAENTFEYEISRRVLPTDGELDTIRHASSDLREPLTLLYETISNDFCRNLVQYLQIIQAYRHLEEAAHIRSVYWEIPPCQGSAALLTEYCMTNQAVQVTGIQSKATFFIGQTVTPYLSAALLGRCHTFLTQGAAPEDLESLYPGINAEIDIIAPAAEAVSPASVSVPGRIPADLAIYLTPAPVFLQTGHTPARVEAREALLDFLSKQPGKSIHIVIYNIHDEDYRWLLSSIEKYSNITLIRNATQASYLTKYAPAAVLMDTPSPYLPDVLREPVPVIVLADPTVVFGDKAGNRLEKAVYCAGGVDEAQRLLAMYFSGALPALEDDVYARKHCNQTGLAAAARQCLGS